MSPVTLRISSTETGFPRVSGDEPDGPNYIAGRLLFSPRERG